MPPVLGGLVAHLVILFIIKIRFCSSSSVSKILSERYGIGGLNLFRKFEKTFKKLQKFKLDLIFLETCQINNTIPKYLNFRLYRRSLEETTFYSNWQTHLLNLEITSKKQSICSLSSELISIKTAMKQTFSFLDFISIQQFVTKLNSKHLANIQHTHDKKLNNLGVNTNLRSANPDNVIFNFSDCSLSNRLMFLLSFGLHFCLPVNNPNFYKHFLPFESLAKRLFDNLQ